MLQDSLPRLRIEWDKFILLNLPLRGKLAEGGGMDYPSFLPESQQPIISSKPRPRQALSLAEDRAQPESSAGVSLRAVDAPL